VFADCRTRNVRGFTLIELAIVLVIVGLLIAAGASLVGPLTRRAKITETQQTVEAAVASLISYAATNHRLPTGSEFPAAVRNSNDSWGRPLTYYFDPNLTAILAGSTDAVCGRRTTNFTICRDVACTAATNIPNVAFIVVSGSENFNTQTGVIAPGGCPAGQTCIGVYDIGTPNIDDFPTDVNRPEEYDDIVRWTTLDELRSKAGCQGTQLRIINDSLPFGQVGVAYNNVSVFADGGVPYAAGGKYRWCIQNTAGTAPASLSFRNQTGTLNIPFSTDCSSLAEGSWMQSDSVSISGSPTPSGSYNLIFFVRDNNDPAGALDNVAQKNFVLTVNPQIAGGGTPPPGAQLSFANDLSSFAPPSGTSGGVVVNGANGTIGLGNGNYGTGSCFWFPTAQTLAGKTMRAYFMFQQTSGTGDGFTFALMQSANASNVCGSGGGYMGYAGIAGGGNIAVEFDVYNNGNVTPFFDPNANHVAIVQSNDGLTAGNYHGSGNPTCGSSGCNSAPGFNINDGITHGVRVEIQTNCNAGCGNCGLGGGNNNAAIKVWANCTSCNDLTSNYSGGSPTASHCFALAPAMNSVKFGFTEGTGGATQTVTLSNFGIGFY